MSLKEQPHIEIRVSGKTLANKVYNTALQEKMLANPPAKDFKNNCMVILISYMGIKRSRAAIDRLIFASNIITSIYIEEIEADLITIDLGEIANTIYSDEIERDLASGEMKASSEDT